MRNLFGRIRRAQESSPDPVERLSLWLGNVVTDHNRPALYPLDALFRHMYISGSTGSGKSTFIEMLLDQLSTFQRLTPFSIHLFDIKGSARRGYSTSLLEAGKEAARKSGAIFKWFISRQDYPTLTWNIMEEPFWQRMSAWQAAAFMTGALGSSHGLTEYGPQYFGGQAVEAETLVLESHKDKIGSLQRNAELVEEHVSGGGYRAKDATQLQNDLKRIARIEPLNYQGQEGAIRLWETLRSPHIIYWCLPPTMMHEVAGAVFRLALHALIDQAVDEAQGIPQIVICDEFDQVVASNLDVLLRQARSMNIGLILANQTPQTLVRKDVDFRPIVKMCGCQLAFDIADPALQVEFCKQSGEAREWLAHARPGVFGSSMVIDGYAQHKTERLDLNTVKKYSAKPNHAFIYVTRDEGHIDFEGLPHVLHVPFHYDQNERNRRENAWWPESAPGCVVVQKPEPKPEPRLEPPPQKAITFRETIRTRP